MLTKTEIRKAFKPITHGLLKEGKKRNFGNIAGWPIEATRMYNPRGVTGPAWNPYYRAGNSNDGMSGTAGPREHVIDWLYRHQR